MTRLTRRLPLSFGVLALLGGCAHLQAESRAITDAEDTSGENDIKEQVLRRLMETYPDRDNVVFCLGDGSGPVTDDVSDEFLARFRNDSLWVTKHSECTQAWPGTPFVPRELAGEAGYPLRPRTRTVFVRTDTGLWMFPCEGGYNLAWLYGDVSCGVFCSYRENFMLERQDARWSIVEQVRSESL